MWTEVLYNVKLIGTIANRETQHTRNMWTKSYSLVLLVLLFTIVNSSTPDGDDGRKCVHGKSFNDGCNSWGCMRGGVVPYTMNLCYDRSGALLEPQKPPEDFWQKNETH